MCIANLKLSPSRNINLRESINDEDVISFLRKAQHQGKFGNLFKFSKNYGNIDGGPEASSVNAPEAEDEVKAESLGRRVAYSNFSTIGN